MACLLKAWHRRQLISDQEFSNTVLTSATSKCGYLEESYPDAGASNVILHWWIFYFKKVGEKKKVGADWKWCHSHSLFLSGRLTKQWPGSAWERRMAEPPLSRAQACSLTMPGGWSLALPSALLKYLRTLLISPCTFLSTRLLSGPNTTPPIPVTS